MRYAAALMPMVLLVLVPPGCGPQGPGLDQEARYSPASNSSCSYAELTPCTTWTQKTERPGYNLQSWLAVDPEQLPYQASAVGPDPKGYLEAVHQFGVEASCGLPRYRATPTATFCNIFAWDVSLAVGAELPHWVHSDGTPSPMWPADRQKGDRELSANALLKWLVEHEGQSKYHRWRRVETLRQRLAGNSALARYRRYRVAHLLPGYSLSDVVHPEDWSGMSNHAVAQQLADAGYPVVAVRLNDLDCDGVFEGSGHIGVVLPTPPGMDYLEEQGPFLAQAGLDNLGVCARKNNGAGTVAHGFFGLLAEDEVGVAGKHGSVSKERLMATVVYFASLGPLINSVLGTKPAPWSCVPVLD